MSQFVRGQFHKYRATNNVHLGKYLIDLKVNTTFDYDGQVVRYEGMAYDVPQLQGMFSAGWFVPVEDTTSQYRSQPAGVQVRPATPEGEARGAAFSMGRASEDEAVVSTMAQAKEIRTAASSDQGRLAELREQRRHDAARRAGLVDPVQDSNPDAPPPRNAADVDPEVEAAFMEDTERQYIQARPVNQAGAQGMSASDAELRQVAEANRLNQERIARATAELERVDPRRTKEEMGGMRHDAPDQGMRKVGGGKYGLIRDEQDDGVPVGNYRFSGGATVGSEESARNAAMAKPVDVTRVASQQPVQVGQAVASTPAANRHAGAVVYDDMMTTHSPQAVRARNTTQVRRGEGNVGIDDIGPGGATGDVDFASSSDDLTELLPGAAVAGLNARRAVQLPPKKTESEEIQEVLDGWSTKRNWQKRVEEAVEFYSDWPEALLALYGIESPAVVKQIQDRIAAKLAEG